MRNETMADGGSMKWRSMAIALAGMMTPGVAEAHPHVLVDVNLEIMRNPAGELIELRHVWRFDEIFSSTVMLDYDTDGDGKLSHEELEEVSKTVTQSIGEQDFFTEVRLKGKTVKFVPPPKIMVSYQDGQILMFFAETFKKPVPVVPGPLLISVSDPTYYVAMELADESAIQITGNGTACKVSIVRPDFDKLYSQNSAALTEQFFNDPKGSKLGDQWMTWVHLNCSS